MISDKSFKKPNLLPKPSDESLCFTSTIRNKCIFTITQKYSI